MIREVIDPAEQKQLLAASMLDLLVAGATTDEQHFFSAHDNARSVVAVVNPDRSVQVFDVTGGTEDERVEYLRSVRDQCASV